MSHEQLHNETARLLPIPGHRRDSVSSSSIYTTQERPINVFGTKKLSLFFTLAGSFVLFFSYRRDFHFESRATASFDLVRSSDGTLMQDQPLWENKREKVDWEPPPAVERCDKVIRLFQEQNSDKSAEDLERKFLKQSEDANVFYRATARIFWLDFESSGWGGELTYKDVGIDAKLDDGSRLSDKSKWTWVTGDQHLSNFGAWRNRHGDIVFSVNDFDEAAIYDFNVDVVRLATSICNHAFTNGLSKKETKSVIHAFTDQYVKTVKGYVGNEDALLYDLTPDDTTGFLHKFLKKVEHKKSHRGMLEKYTQVDPDTGVRTLIKSNHTRLAGVNQAIEDEIRGVFTSDKYGATLMKTGWHVREPWSDEYYKVIDVAERLGSGVGSYGVDRYYVLINGGEGLAVNEGPAIILDVKFAARPAVLDVLDKDDLAWYDVLFRNQAARVVEAQRRLTTYVDPFTGWVMIFGRAFIVRQRSPWKSSPNLDKLTSHEDFVEFIEQVATATATSHVRGTVAKSPAEFKHALSSVLGNKSNRQKWGELVSRAALKYHDQVLLDFNCFHKYVQAAYPQERAEGI